MRPGRLPEDHPLEQAARARLREKSQEAKDAEFEALEQAAESPPFSPPPEIRRRPPPSRRPEPPVPTRWE